MFANTTRTSAKGKLLTLPAYVKLGCKKVEKHGSLFSRSVSDEEFYRMCTWTIAHPSFVLRNLILVTFPYKQNRLNNLGPKLPNVLRP